MLNKSMPELEGALSLMVKKINDILESGGYTGEPISMYLAGGMAVNYYCGTRYTEDVDASFSRRILLPKEDLVVDYIRADGSLAYIYLDKNYNSAFALMHEDFERDAVAWSPMGASENKIQLKLLSPLDLAVSKIARFGDQDVEDILSLAREGLFTSDELSSRALEALSYFVGNLSSVKNSIEIVCKRIHLELDSSSSRHPTMVQKLT